MTNLDLQESSSTRKVELDLPEVYATALYRLAAQKGISPDELVCRALDVYESVKEAQDAGGTVVLEKADGEYLLRGDEAWEPRTPAVTP